MINLRYHIVSIVAVFLALGIGVVMGTSFIDGFLVKELNQNLDQLEQEKVKDEEEIEQLNAEINQNAQDQGKFNDAAALTIFSRRLADVPLLIVADRGVDETVIEKLHEVMLTTSARYQGRVWIEDQMDTTDDGNLAHLAAMLGLTEDAGADAVDRALRTEMRGEFVVDGGASVGSYLGRSGANDTITSLPFTL